MFFLWSVYSQFLEIRANDKYEILSHWDDGWEFQHLVNIILLPNLPYCYGMSYMVTWSWQQSYISVKSWNTMGISTHYIKRPLLFKVKTANTIWMQQQFHGMFIQKHTRSTVLDLYILRESLHTSNSIF